MAYIIPVRGFTPKIGKDCFLAPNATIVGDTTLGDGCSIWFNAVLRGDVNTIRLGNHVNIQDGSVLHTLFQKSTIEIGDYVSVGHNVTIHGAHIQDFALIGMGSTLLDNVVVGEGAIVAAGALVLKNTQIGANEVWGGVPAKFIKKVDTAQANELNRKIAYNYAMYASWYEGSDLNSDPDSPNPLREGAQEVSSAEGSNLTTESGCEVSRACVTNLSPKADAAGTEKKTMYKRILLKLSGESLMGQKGYGIDEQRLAAYARQIKEIAATGVQVAIVIGGGNIFRGLSGSQKGFDRVKGDQMGMLATTINSLALQSALEAAGQPTRVLTSVRMEPIGDFYNKAKALRLLEKGNVVIVAGGTGNPYFTTDTGSSLRAIELEADIMFKGTRVDGIYTADPEKDPTATKYTEISYSEILSKGLKIMDLTAITMCMENGMPIYVFDMDTEGNLLRVVKGEPIGTLVKP